MLNERDYMRNENERFLERRRLMPVAEEPNPSRVRRLATWAWTHCRLNSEVLSVSALVLGVAVTLYFTYGKPAEVSAVKPPIAPTVLPAVKPTNQPDPVTPAPSIQPVSVQQSKYLNGFGWLCWLVVPLILLLIVGSAGERGGSVMALMGLLAVGAAILISVLGAWDSFWMSVVWVHRQ